MFGGGRASEGNRTPHTPAWESVAVIPECIPDVSLLCGKNVAHFVAHLLHPWFQIIGYSGQIEVLSLDTYPQEKRERRPASHTLQ